MAIVLQKTDVKCVVVGDGAVGKTCMLISYTENSFPEGYVPTVFDNYEAQVLVEDTEVTFSLWDTAGQEGYQRIRVLSYPKTDLFLVCFSVANRHSFENVSDTWMRELKHHCPHTPIILVGTKIDLRKSGGEKMNTDYVSASDGRKLAETLNAICYMECSAKTREGLKAVFDRALTHVVIGGGINHSSGSQKGGRKKIGKKNCILF